MLSLSLLLQVIHVLVGLLDSLVGLSLLLGAQLNQALQLLDLCIVVLNLPAEVTDCFCDLLVLLLALVPLCNVSRTFILESLDHIIDGLEDTIKVSNLGLAHLHSKSSKSEASRASDWGSQRCIRLGCWEAGCVLQEGWGTVQLQEGLDTRLDKLCKELSGLIAGENLQSFIDTFQFFIAHGTAGCPLLMLGLASSLGLVKECGVCLHLLFCIIICLGSVCEHGLCLSFLRLLLLALALQLVVGLFEGGIHLLVVSV